MISEIGICNLWLPFFLGYAMIWYYMIIVDKKRGSKIEDEELHKSENRISLFVKGFLPTLVLLIVSIFTPISFGYLFVPGSVLYLTGITIVILALRSFMKTDSGLNTKSIYRFTRNPMYVGGFGFIAGINLMGDFESHSFWLFLVLTLIWSATVHFHVLQEEEFLKKKYKDEYINFCLKVPRYLGVIKK